MIALTDFTECEMLMRRNSWSLREVERLDAILGRRRDVLHTWDIIANVAHRCESDECCEEPETYSADVAHLLTQPGWVYALSTWQGEVLYVGKTDGPLHRRIRQHSDDSMEDRSPCWRKARSLHLYPDLVIGWNVGDTALRLEKAAILALQPPLNTKGIS